MPKHSRRPLILGASGRVGRAFRALWQAGLWPDRSEPIWHYRGGDAPDALIWDMAGPVPDDPRLTEPGPVICLAGATRGEDLASNTRTALAAVYLARQTGRGPVLVASSTSVYGHGTGARTETDACHPIGPYGAAKLEMERALEGSGATCLRIANVAGCGALFDNAAAGPVRLHRFADGRGPRRAHVGPLSLARALIDLDRIAAAGTPLPAVLNLGNPGIVSMDDILAAAGVDWTWLPAGPDDLPELALDTARQDALITVAPVTPELLVAEARAAGWSPAR